MGKRFILLKRKHDLNEGRALLLDTGLGSLPDLKAINSKKNFTGYGITMILKKAGTVTDSGEFIVSIKKK